MAVWYRQTVDGEALDDPHRIEPHYEGQPDDELLFVKAQGAAAKDWTVEWTGKRSFTATKTRWANEAHVVREFWVDD